MRLTYDPEADSILLTLGEADLQAESWAEPAEGMVIDFDRNKNPISIEIQGASQRYPAETLSAISLEQPMALAQLATEYEIGRAHVLTPVTDQSRMPSSA